MLLLLELLAMVGVGRNNDTAALLECMFRRVVLVVGVVVVEVVDDTIALLSE